MRIDEKVFGQSKCESRSREWPFSVNGGPSTSKGQLCFLQGYVIDIIEISKPPQHKNKSFLQQKYVIEGLSLRDIASIAGASKATISKYLKFHGFKVQKPGANRHKKPLLAYGEKRFNGEIVAKQSEMKVIETILDLHEHGLSFRAIAQILDKMKVPTKRQGKGWHHSMVSEILNKWRE